MSAVKALAFTKSSVYCLHGAVLRKLLCLLWGIRDGRSCDESKLSFRPSGSGQGDKHTGDTGTNDVPDKVTLSPCRLCQTLFPDDLMSEHLKTVHRTTLKTSTYRVAPCTCEICQKKFNSKDGLLRHTNRVHIRSVVATCPTCGKTFTDLANYRQHKLIHTGDRLYVCQVCGQSFVQSQALKSHFSVHAMPQYFCSICRQGFRQRENMKRHMQTHLGTKKHQCETCGKSFLRKDHLKQHSWIHKDEWPYPCQICPQQFNDSTGLKNHMKSKHWM